MMNSILLSFDLEEFDIPEEYGQKLSVEKKLNVTLSGLLPLLELIASHNVTATFYTTVFFAEAYPEIVKRIASNHEIASHGVNHSSFNPGDISSSKMALEKITGIAVSGFRMARFMKFDTSLLTKAGYSYNSSLNPAFIPGRYNNFTKPRKPFIEEGLVNLPASVATILRVPLFWLSFKNFPFSFYTKLAVNALQNAEYLNIYFHPWEFACISGYNLPGYIKRESGKALLVKFDKLLTVLKEHGEFIKSGEYSRFFLKNNG